MRLLKVPENQNCPPWRENGTKMYFCPHLSCLAICEEAGPGEKTVAEERGKVKNQDAGDVGNDEVEEVRPGGGAAAVLAAAAADPVTCPGAPSRKTPAEDTSSTTFLVIFVK